MRKCAAALANWIALMILGLVGFVSPIEENIDGVAVLINQPQSDAVLFAIKGILSFSSILLLAPATVIALRWLLTKEKHAALIGFLDRKRAGMEIDEEMEEEIREICKPLI